MDVRLPDGRVIQGVPDGTTRDQLAQKLQANGMQVPQEWMTTAPPEQPLQPPATARDRVSAIGSGFNRGIASVAGIPTDLGLNVFDLIKAGIGVTYGGITGKAPPASLDPTDRAGVVGSSEYIANLMNRSRVTNTQLSRPDDKASRYLYAGGAGAAGGALLGPATGAAMLPSAVSGTTSALASNAAAEGGGGPVAQTLAGIAGGAVPFAAQAGVNATRGAFARKPQLTAEQTLSQQMGGQGSQGAAAAVPDLSRASPELRSAVVAAGKKGGVNMSALEKQQQAQSLPVPVKLTAGQATGDPVMISREQNMRGAQPRLAERFAEQNRQLVENLQAVREQVGPDVFTTNAVEHADSLIQSYRKIDKALSADIGAKYKALADANGGQLPIDGNAFLKAAAENLSKNNKARFLPPEIKRTLADIAKKKRVETNPLTFDKVTSSGMTFGEFENLRTTLAAASRQAERAGNGNAVGAIAQVRDALENMPLPAGSEGLKGLADAARNASRARFEMLAQDPAYKAAVNKTVRPDLFVRRFVLNGDAAKVDLMRRNLASDPVAGQTISVAALEHLRDAARISSDWKGNFTQAGFSKMLQQLDPKAKSLFTPEALETLSNLRDVASNTMFQPKGSFVNNSNTFVAGAAEYGASAAEGAANVAAGGVPVGTWVRKAGQKFKTGKELDNILSPGAGIAVGKKK